MEEDTTPVTGEPTSIETVCEIADKAPMRAMYYPSRLHGKQTEIEDVSEGEVSSIRHK